jgi:hypothetical protein
MTVSSKIVLPRKKKSGKNRILLADADLGVHDKVRLGSDRGHAPQHIRIDRSEEPPPESNETRELLDIKKGKHPRAFHLKASAGKITIIGMVFILSVASGYMYRNKDSLHLEDLVRWEWLQRMFFRQPQGTAVLALDPFILPKNSSSGTAGLISLEMVVHDSALGNVRNQLASVRGLIFTSICQNKSEDLFTKKNFDKMARIINQRLGEHAILTVRAKH